jgi:hypothetical protein
MRNKILLPKVAITPALLNPWKTCDTYFISQVHDSAIFVAVQNYILMGANHTSAKLWVAAMLTQADTLKKIWDIL